MLSPTALRKLRWIFQQIIVPSFSGGIRTDKKLPDACILYQIYLWIFIYTTLLLSSTKTDKIISKCGFVLISPIPSVTIASCIFMIRLVAYLILRLKPIRSNSPGKSSNHSGLEEARQLLDIRELNSNGSEYSTFIRKSRDTWKDGTQSSHSSACPLPTSTESLLNDHMILSERNGNITIRTVDIGPTLGESTRYQAVRHRTSTLGDQIWYKSVTSDTELQRPSCIPREKYPSYTTTGFKSFYTTLLLRNRLRKVKLLFSNLQFAEYLPCCIDNPTNVKLMVIIPLLTLVTAYLGQNWAVQFRFLPRVWFCAYLTSVIFSLMKSVQPEPIQLHIGYSAENAYLRFFYFLSLNLLRLLEYFLLPTGCYGFYGILLSLPLLHCIGLLPSPSFCYSLLLDKMQYFITGVSMSTKASAMVSISVHSLSCLGYVLLCKGREHNVGIALGYLFFMTNFLHHFEFRYIFTKLQQKDRRVFPETIKTYLTYMDKFFMDSLILGIAGSMVGMWLESHRTIQDSIYLGLVSITSIFGLMNYIFHELLRPNPFGIFRDWSIAVPTIQLVLQRMNWLQKVMWPIAVVVLGDLHMGNSVVDYVDMVVIAVVTYVLINGGKTNHYTVNFWMALLLTWTSSFDVKLIINRHFSYNIPDIYLLWTYLVIICPYMFGFMKRLWYFYCVVAPSQLVWGSAMHAIIQPIMAPHGGITILNIFLSTILNSPMMPIVGSVWFQATFPRLTRFWTGSSSNSQIDTDEQKLKTVNQQNTPPALHELVEQLRIGKKQPSNAIFYEVLEKFFQKNLFSMLKSGEFGGNVSGGDIFLLRSHTGDDYTVLVHFIQVTSEYVTFQLRGLELKGTYCQQRELEALFERTPPCGWIQCITSPRHYFKQILRCWKMIRDEIKVQCYSISTGSVNQLLQAYTPRKVFFEYLGYAIIYRLFQLPRTARKHILIELATNEEYLKQLRTLGKPHREESAPVQKLLKQESISTEITSISADIIPRSGQMQFFSNLLNIIKNSSSDQNYEQRFAQIFQDQILQEREINHLLIDELSDKELIKELKSNTTQQSSTSTKKSKRSKFMDKFFNHGEFHKKYEKFVEYIQNEKNENFGDSEDYLDLALGLCYCTSTCLKYKDRFVDTIMNAYNSAFHGDLRINETWTTIHDMVIWEKILKTAIRDILGLVIDYYVDFEIPPEPKDIIAQLTQDRFILPEYDPIWRSKILETDNKSTVMTLRHNRDDNSPHRFSFLQANIATIKFKLFKLNEEMVRAIWAAQQHELIYLKTENAERGSVQYAPSILRNMISSSSDLPLGYPVYVSPLTTSFGISGILTHPRRKRIQELFKSAFSSLIQQTRNSVFGLNPLSAIRAQQIEMEEIKTEVTATVLDETQVVHIPGYEIFPLITASGTPQPCPLTPVTDRASETSGVL